MFLVMNSNAITESLRDGGAQRIVHSGDVLHVANKGDGAGCGRDPSQ